MHSRMLLLLDVSVADARRPSFQSPLHARTTATTTPTSRRVPLQTLLGLFAQEAQYRVLKTHHLHKANVAAYCAK